MMNSKQECIIHIYILEDDHLILNGLQQCFKWVDHGVVVVGVANNGKTALREIRKSKVDILLTDIVVPGMNGIDLAKTLRAEGWDGEIIMMSAYQDKEYLYAALQTHSIDYLFKPMKTAELTASIRNTVRRVRKMRGFNTMTPFEWQKLMTEGIEEKNADVVDHALREAWLSTHLDRNPSYSLQEVASDVFRFCRDKVCLEGAETICTETIEKINAVEGFDPVSTEYDKGRIRLVKLLRENPVEWSFSIDLVKNIIEDIGNAEPNMLAAKMHCSRSTLYRRYDHAAAMSLNDRIQQLRIRVAADLLANSRMRIFDVARRVGYTDVNYFSRIFSEQIGILPSKWRSQMNNAIEDDDDESGDL